MIQFSIFARIYKDSRKLDSVLVLWALYKSWKSILYTDASQQASQQAGNEANEQHIDVDKGAVIIMA